MSDADSEREMPNVDDAPMALTLIQKLIDRHPAWRVTSHTSPSGHEALMIEFADDNYEFVSGLPSEFISLIENAGGDEHE